MAPPSDSAPLSAGKQSEFVAALGHELRSPLNAVIGLSDALLAAGGPFDTERTARYLGMIQSSGRKHLAQLNDLIDIARSDCGRLKLDEQPFDLTRLCASSFESAKSDATGKSLFSILQNFTQPVVFVGDERLLGRALRHLLTRAFKVSPASGRVQLGTMRTELGATIAVSDSGESIGPGGFASLIQLPAGADPMQLGATELGLAFADCAVRLHGGTITAAATSSGGTTLVVNLPASRLKS
jgi:signal transduction histidine kinase